MGILLHFIYNTLDIFRATHHQCRNLASELFCSSQRRQGPRINNSCAVFKEYKCMGRNRRCVRTSEGRPTNSRAGSQHLGINRKSWGVSILLSRILHLSEFETSINSHASLSFCHSSSSPTSQPFLPAMSTYTCLHDCHKDEWINRKSTKNKRMLGIHLYPLCVTYK